MVTPVIVIAIALTGIGCGGKTTTTPKGNAAIVVDDLGRRVNVPNNLTRIVSLASSTTEILYDLGCGDMVVGVDKNSNYPPEVKKKPIVGTGSSVNTEALLSLKPDLAFAWYYDEDTIAKIESYGIPVVAINPQSVDDVYKTIEMVGKITGKEARAKEIVQGMQSKISAVADQLKGVPKDKWPRVYYELQAPMKTVGPGTFTDEIIGLAGGMNIAESKGAKYPILSSEYIVERNPNVIVVVSYGTPVKEIKARGGWNNISAVKDNRVYEIDSDLVTCTPRLVDGLQQMARWYHPELFKKSS